MWRTDADFSANDFFSYNREKPLFVGLDSDLQIQFHFRVFPQNVFRCMQRFRSRTH